MEGGTRREIENEEARDREELFNIGDYHVEEAPWCTILVVSVPGDRGARQLQGDPEGGGEMKPL